ncbi:hypothetical protein B0A48_18648 [Cryoendolithus antarcticus]|uniref:Zn(2)-C6 fungal-type domain-containing protein n=2 Tax=Cryoendolithus antarcticus TaxID=1507870 RepID=A0A1V8S7X8_9PEZI|nr:hypothetical protein B0A48_18648 [Cryoendolithus antarcticus]
MPTPRTRVRKACDRCRLKKGKCDGLFPCNRCKDDDSICAFSQRRIDRNRVYTRSHIELLERQHWQLVAGIREMYKRLQQADALPVTASNDSSKTLDIHSVLHSLGVVHEDCDENMDYEETSDGIVDMHRDEVDRYSLSGSMDSGCALESERELSLVSNASYGVFGDASMQATDSTLVPEFLGVVSPKASNRSSNLVQSSVLQALQVHGSPVSTESTSQQSLCPRACSVQKRPSTPPAPGDLSAFNCRLLQ